MIKLVRPLRFSTDEVSCSRSPFMFAPVRGALSMASAPKPFCDSVEKKCSFVWFVSMKFPSVFRRQLQRRYSSRGCSCLPALATGFGGQRAFRALPVAMVGGLCLWGLELVTAGAAGWAQWLLAESNGRKWRSPDLAPTVKWPCLQRRPITPPEPRVTHKQLHFYSPVHFTLI